MFCDKLSSQFGYHATLYVDFKLLKICCNNLYNTHSKTRYNSLLKTYFMYTCTIHVNNVVQICV